MKPGGMSLEPIPVPLEGIKNIVPPAKIVSPENEYNV
jgi:hypothetical protein